MTLSASAVCAGVLAATGLGAAPAAQADPLSDAFLSALNNAGVNYGDPGNAVALGQSICPMLAQPGGSFAAAASSIANNGVSPDMASLFTNIAISMYCPQMVASVANGSFLNNGGMPALPFQIPGLPGF
ncbi:MAG: DUF732 domain-containing protein [Mycobacteriaceae bacterium]|nr:DUF732 domain-containing protein [Mycobacteriaceae bacterium]